MRRIRFRTVMSLEMTFEDGARKLRFRVRPLRAPVSQDGLFADGSVIRTVYADSVCMLGAGTALLLQLAHPSIAQGVHDHSNYEDRPLDRLFGTLFATSAVVFGSRADAGAIGSAIGRVHTKVSGPGYSALDPALLCWVNATLLGTATQLYQQLIRPLRRAELDEFVVDSRRVGEVFGCPLDAQPASWAEFERYWDATISSLRVEDPARRVAASLLSGQGLPLRRAWLPMLAVARAVTAATLPPELREEYGLPWRRRDQALAKGTLGAAGEIFPRLPEKWRQLGPELFRSPVNPTLRAA
jgi:uncharacterized protein (DUF2236 family)